MIYFCDYKNIKIRLRLNGHARLQVLANFEAQTVSSYYCPFRVLLYNCWWDLTQTPLNHWRSHCGTYILRRFWLLFENLTASLSWKWQRACSQNKLVIFGLGIYSYFSYMINYNIVMWSQGMAWAGWTSWLTVWLQLLFRSEYNFSFYFCRLMSVSQWVGIVRCVKRLQLEARLFQSLKWHSLGLRANLDRSNRWSRRFTVRRFLDILVNQPATFSFGKQ